MSAARDGIRPFRINGTAATIAATSTGQPQNVTTAATTPDLAAYETLLLDQILAIEPVTDARSTFAIRAVLSRGALPLDALP